MFGLSSIFSAMANRISSSITGDLQKQIARVVNSWNSHSQNPAGGGSGGRSSSPVWQPKSPSAGFSLPVQAMQWAMGKASSPISRGVQSLAKWQYARAKNRFQKSRSAVLSQKNYNANGGKSPANPNAKKPGSSAAKKPNSSPILDWFSTVNDWINAHKLKKEEKQAASYDANKAQMKFAGQNVRDSMAWKPKGFFEKLMDKIEGNKPAQHRIDPSSLNASTPQGIVQQMQNSLGEKSNADQRNMRWKLSRQTPFALIGRAQKLAGRAAANWKTAEEKRVKLKGVYDNAKKRFFNAPAKGTPGYNPKKTTSLFTQMGIARKAYQGAESKAAAGLERLTQTTRMYSQSTSAMAGSLRFVGTAVAKAGGTILAGIQTFISTPRIAETLAESGMEARRWTAEYSSRAGVAFNNYDLASQSLNFAHAEQTAPSTVAFSKELLTAKSNLVKFKIWTDNMVTDAGTLALRGWNLAGKATQSLTDIAVGPWGMDKEFWDQEKKRREQDAKDILNKGSDTFQMVFSGWQGVDKDKKDARNNSKEKKPLPPLK